MAVQTRLEPMNASPYHSKVRASLKLADSTFVAGGTVNGKMEVECKSDMGLGIGLIMVELIAIEELTSRDHSATSTFLHSRRLFQGPGLPPSNAVRAYLVPGDPPLPSNYYPARRGMTTFPFNIPLSDSSPSAIDFGLGLARVTYELRASVGVAWKGENRLVVDSKQIDVVESFEEDFSRAEPEGVVVGENGKIWVQGKVVGGFAVAGQPACIELQVKNHSSRKNTGLSVSLTRELYLPNVPLSQKQPLQISDTLTSVSFRGQEYIIPPGAEGVANLVFDLPRNARGVKGGTRQGDREDITSDPLFEVRCIVSVKLTMGAGSKDIQTDIPVPVLHPLAVLVLPPDPSPLPLQSYAASIYDPSPMIYSSPASPAPYMDHPFSLYTYSPPLMSPPPMSPLPMSPPLIPYVEYGQVWLPPPQPHHSFSPPPLSHQYYYPPPTVAQSMVSPWSPPPRPSSAEPLPSQTLYTLPPGIPASLVMQPLIPTPTGNQSTAEREEGKGERASRIAMHLRLSSRHRSTSPPAHRFSTPSSEPTPMTASSSALLVPVPASPQTQSPASSPHTQVHHPRTPNLTLSPVVSPRPMLSPKRSFSEDPFVPATHVQTLERIATRAAGGHAELSGPELELGLESAAERNKTLPAPPVPTDKRARADSLFPGKTPPTPTLAAIASLKAPRGGGGLSGLDALEAKLLAEVGTRKPETTERHADVRAVLPIAIQRPDAADPANDSVISSLALPGLEADAMTLRLGRADYEEEDKAASDRERKEEWESRVATKGGSSGARKERYGGKRSGEHISKDGEVHKLRKAAQGRVAAWLGCIDPDTPPPSATPPPASPQPAVEDAPARPRSTPMEQEDRETPLMKETPQETLKQDVSTDISAAPNPRSSGFVPIGTLRTNTFQRSTVAQNTRKSDMSTKDVPHAKVAVASRPALYPPQPLDPEVRYDFRSARGGRGGKVTSVAAIWASAAQQVEKVDAKPKPNPIVRALAVPARKVKEPAVKSPVARKTVPSLDPAKPATKPILVSHTSPDPRAASVADVTAKHARMNKSASVPAVISSSLATPMLSSTASLARPSPPLSERYRMNIKLPPTISEGAAVAEAKPAAPKAPHTKGELAFGQARLRELIKRYQGHTQ